MNYQDFFVHATGVEHGPYDYQRRLAEGQSFREMLKGGYGIRRELLSNICSI